MTPPAIYNHDLLYAQMRSFAAHSARVYLAEAARRRHSRVDRDFYWLLLRWARNAIAYKDEPRGQLRLF